MSTTSAMSNIGNTRNAAVEYESLLRLDQPLGAGSSVPMARWQRKAAAAAAAGAKDAPGTPDRCARTPGRVTLSRGMKTPSRDRFIPTRTGDHYDLGHFNVENSAPDFDVSPSKLEYKNALADNLMPDSKVLAFKAKAPAPPEGYVNNLRVLYTNNKAAMDAVVGRGKARHVDHMPTRILDGPELVDDYYLNLLDWGDNNVLAVALGQTVYLWNSEDKSIVELLKLEDADNYVTSVSWMPGRNFLAVGTNNHTVQLWDVERMAQISELGGHMGRVGALAWNQHILSSGSRDSMIFHHDVRVREHHIDTLEGHHQEVCGLKWSPDGTVLASGGNDNLLNIWDINNSDAPKFTMDQHQAAVKALAWCPWQKDLLASGGGTADRSIRFWNTSNGACLNTVDTRSQVCSLLWSKTYKELISSHGFSQNQLIVWKYPSMVKTAELTGHTSRVLHMAMSPDGSTVVSAAADETLRFWNVFAPSEKSRSSKKSSSAHSLLSGSISLR